MIGKFPIRPLNKQDESLSGYIMRSSDLLDIDPKHLLKYIYSNINFYYPDIDNRTRLPYFKVAFSLDVAPFRFLNKVEFCKMLDRTPEEIEAITFSNIFKKFNYNLNIERNKYGAVLSGRVVNNFRRFCPMCLKEYGIYKLLWQVKEIVVCDIHKIKLQHKCPNCQEKQKYYSQELAKFTCCKCGHLLWENAQTNEQYNEEINYYDDWRFLLDPKSRLCKPIEGMDDERTLAILCIYVMQSQEAYFLEENLKIFHARTTREFIRFIKGKEDGNRITFQALIKIIRETGLSVKEFSEITVPKTYIDSLLKKETPFNRRVVCLSPWCKHYNSDKMLERIKARSSRDDYYTNKFVCLGCFIVYSFSIKNNSWETINKPLFDNIMNVKELILLDRSKKDMTSELNIGTYMLNKIIGYLLNYGNLPEYYKNKYVSKTIPSDIIDKFKYLSSIEGEGFKKAKKKYGWSETEYNYYYWLAQVQKQLYFDEKIREVLPRRMDRIKKCNWEKELLSAIKYFWDNDIDISWENLEKHFSLSWRNLKQNNLTEIVQENAKLQKYKRTLDYLIRVKRQVSEYINNCTCEKLTLGILYNELELSLSKIKRNHKGLGIWISKEIYQYNQSSLYKLHEEYKQKINSIVSDSYERGENISIKKISLMLGRGSKYINKYPQLEQYTKCVMERYFK